MERAVLIYDGQCPRCIGAARFLLGWAKGKLEIRPLDDPSVLDLHRDLSYPKMLEAVHLVMPNGYLCKGAEAAANALAQRPGFKFLGVLYYLPLIKQLSQLFYFLVKRRTRGCESCSS